MTEQEIKTLVQRYLDNVALPAELQTLERVLRDARHEATVKALLYDSYELIKNDAVNRKTGWAVKERIYHRIMEYDQESTHSGGSKRRWWLVAAASLLIVSTIGIFYLDQRRQQHEQQLVHETIRPGGNNAYLILADGEQISLGEIANGTIAEQEGMTISKTADGELVYQIRDHAPDTRADLHHTIETPNGGQYRVRLPDSTVIWLNSATRLTYPARFAAKAERRVQLTGEAYFEVAPDAARPFIVVSDNQEVQVLGTHFNISAYAEDPNIKTTLLEGRVKVGIVGQPVSEMLAPGEQAVNIRGALVVSTTNTAYAVAWKDGYFRFNQKTLEFAMREIARWYNVSVTYENPARRNEVLAGTISKYSSIEQVLEKMELTGAFHFVVKDNEIIVK